MLRLAKLKPEQQRLGIRDLKELGKLSRKPRVKKQLRSLSVPQQPKALVKVLLQELGVKGAVEVSKELAAAVPRPA